MSEKRKPAVKLTLAVAGRRRIYELYPADLWPNRWRPTTQRQYRVRINGTWRQPDKPLTMRGVFKLLEGHEPL